MILSFEPLTIEHSTEIVAWRYEAPYDIYEYPKEEHEQAIQFLAKEQNQFFAVLNECELIGFRSFGKDGQVAGGIYPDTHLDTGGGIRPDLTGKGLGKDVIQQGLQFGSQRFNTSRFRVTIATFNQRAQKVCYRLGFKKDHEFNRQLDGKPFDVLTLDLTPS